VLQTAKEIPVHTQLSTEPVSLIERPIRNIKMKQKHEGVCAVPDCKGIPSFGPILMPHDLTFKEAYLCVAHRLLILQQRIKHRIEQAKKQIHPTHNRAFIDNVLK
jgi:hypothetical protein